MTDDLDRRLSSLKARARWSRGLLIANIVMMVGMLAFTFALMIWLARSPGGLPLDGEPTAGKTALRLALAFTGIAWILISIALPVIVLLWIHRAHGNLRALRLEGLNYAPGWAVGSFFVPLINLVVPFRAMRELCNRSFGESEYQAHEPVSDVSAWWTCLIAGSLIQAFLIVRELIQIATPVRLTAPPLADAILGLLTYALLIGSAFFLQRIIGSVTKAQTSVTGIDAAFA